MICRWFFFIVNTWINKIYLSYFKPSFGLGIYIIKLCFQYIIILLITFNLDVWIHIIYPHKIFIMDNKSIYLFLYIYYIIIYIISDKFLIYK